MAINEEHSQPDETLLFVSGAMLLIALATLVIRFGYNRFPSAEPPARGDSQPRGESAHAAQRLPDGRR